MIYSSKTPTPALPNAKIFLLTDRQKHLLHGMHEYDQFQKHTIPLYKHPSFAPTFCTWQRKTMSPIQCCTELLNGKRNQIKYCLKAKKKPKKVAINDR